MKETYELSVQLPFGDFAMVEWEMTEEEYEEFLEYCCDENIWDEDQFQDLLSAAAVAAANYIVGFYCETDDAEEYIDEHSCTPEKLMEHLDISEEYLDDFMNGDGNYKREMIMEMLWEHQAFYMEEG